MRLHKTDLTLPGSDWRIVLAAVEGVGKYMDRLERALDEEYSSGIENDDSRYTEDAVLLLDHRLGKSLFSMAAAWPTCRRPRLRGRPVSG